MQIYNGISKSEIRTEILAGFFPVDGLSSLDCWVRPQPTPNQRASDF